MITALQFSPDGSYLAVARQDSRIEWWSYMFNALKATTTCQQGEVRQLVLLKEGMLINGKENRFFWDYKEEIKDLTPLVPNGSVVSFSPDGQYTASARSVSSIRFDSSERTETQLDPILLVIQQAPEYRGVQVCFASALGEKFRIAIPRACIFSPRTAVFLLHMVLNIEKNRWCRRTYLGNISGSGAMRSIPCLPNEMTPIAFHPQGDQIVFSHISPHGILVRDLRGEMLGKLMGHTGSITALAFSPDGKWLGSASKGQTFRIWDLENQSESVRYHLSDYVTAIAWSPDGKHIALGDAQGEIWKYSHGADSPPECMKAVIGRRLRAEGKCYTSSKGSALYAAIAEYCLNRYVRTTTFLDKEGFLADMKDMGVPDCVIQEYLGNVGVDDDTYLTDRDPHYGLPKILKLHRP